ncbi:MAG: TRAP transporter TatT component family protein [Spirochaetota bacterium]|nr:TRAP transporter TatT component family protein [Spirochaetota bacterium]
MSFTKGIPEIFYVSMLFIIVLNSCSINKIAMNNIADALSSSEGNTVFTGDNDPELVGDALPFALKMYESFLTSLPHHYGLRLKTGSMYIMYANAFLQTPAEMLSNDESKKQKLLMKRSKNLYLRGRDILLPALEMRYPGFLKKLNEKRFDKALEPVNKEDVPFLYWSSLGWLGAFAIDPLDMKLGLTISAAEALMHRAMELDEGFLNGAIHDFYILYYGSLPDYMGGDFQKARTHFRKALEFSKGKSTSAYISLATTVSIKQQNRKEFTELLNKVLELNADEIQDDRLVNILNQRKARWLLNHVNDFFLVNDMKIDNDR